MQSFKEFVATDKAFASLLSKSGHPRGANLGPVNPYADPENDPLAKPNIISIQNVRSGKIFDARCLDMQNPEAKKKAVAAMLAAVRSILTDEDAHVMTKAEEDKQKFGPTTTWGKLYPNAVQLENGIQIEYWQTATQNVVGRTLWSAGDVAHRPLQVTGEKLGLRTSPEHLYSGQFENELQDLANRKLLLGWPQNWAITTTKAARDIKLLLKEAEIV